MALNLPEGFSSAGVACGIKTDGLDLGLLVVDGPAAWAGTFTKNGAAAACVHWCRSLLRDPVRAVVVNSGNANACTGGDGEKAVKATAEAVGATLGCSEREILVASTGPIGVPLPVEKVISGAVACAADLGSDASGFSRSILTTDTVSKVARAERDGFAVVGVAKGAAMLAPNMATMLAFLTTDAAVGQAALQRVLSRAVARSFDRISVDACESTNDSVFLLSSGRSDPVEEEDLAAAVGEVCLDLAEQMVRDAEGGSRLVRIQVSGASDEAAAVDLGRGVAASALWRSAVHGADPNWGRVLSALGSVDRDLDLSQVTLTIGSVAVFTDGAPTNALAAAGREMDRDEFVVGCRVGSADTHVEILTTDLSPEYVAINASGSS